MKELRSKTKKFNGKKCRKSSTDGELAEEDSSDQGADTSRNHLDDRSWIKNRIRFNMQLVEDFQQVKEDRDLDKREKAYYNEQIEEAQEKVRVLTKLAEGMAERCEQ
jgi:hypothetical protein